MLTRIARTSVIIALHTVWWVMPADLTSCHHRESGDVEPEVESFPYRQTQGTLGKEFSFVSSNNRNVIIKALKKAENSDEYVVRVYEMGGEKVQDAVLSFAGEIASACEADGTEKSIGSAEFSGNGLSVSIKPYSVKTFKVRLKSSGEDAYQLQYASLSLSYNYNVHHSTSFAVKLI